MPGGFDAIIVDEFVNIKWEDAVMRLAIALITVFFLSILFSCQGGTAQDSKQMISSETRDGVFVHISHGGDEPHRLLMALQMAVLMSETQDVLVYIDIKGVETVVKDAKNITYAQFPGSEEQIGKLLKAGVTVMACPGCLKAAGYTPENLREGVKVADKQVFFNFTEGRILTLDY